MITAKPRARGQGSSLSRIRELLERAYLQTYNNVKTLLATHKKELHGLANALIEQETLDGKSDKGSSCTGKRSAATKYSIQTDYYPPRFSTPNPSAAAAEAKGIAPVGS